MWINRVGDAARRGLERFDSEELAYLALTSKFEMPFRDSLAFEMYGAYPWPRMQTAREWKKTDIAVIEDGEPVVLLEAKAFYTFDAVKPKKWTDYTDHIEKDIAKAKKLGVDGTELMVAAVMTHVASVVPDAFAGVVKYIEGINKALTTDYPNAPDKLRADACEQIEATLASVGGTEVKHATASGEAYGLAVTVDSFIVGEC